MYFGTVKFFKDLIIIGIITIITVSVGLAIFFGVNYFTLRDAAVPAISIDELQTSDDTEKSPNIPTDIEISQFYAQLLEQGVTDEEILSYIEAQNPDAFNDYIAALEAYRSAPEYTRNYPELYVTPAAQTSIKDKTIYLTFDDGPSENTLGILSILKKYNIKATFFMCGSETEEGKAIMKKVAEDGHSIGIHSISHDYSVIYTDVDSFLTDMQNTSDNIYEATGVKPDIIRFAGGSINNYNKDISDELIAEVERRGYAYFDWNVSAQDASTKATWTTAYNNILGGVKGRNNAIVLMHNKRVSLHVTEDIIVALLDEGYEFDKLTNATTPTHFRQPPKNDEDITG